MIADNTSRPKPEPMSFYLSYIVAPTMTNAICVQWWRDFKYQIYEVCLVRGAFNMFRSISRVLLPSLLCVAAAPVIAQAVQAGATLLRGKSVLEFYEAAVVNPQQVLLLSVEIQSLLHNSSTRYKELNNDLAQKMGWFDKGPLGLEHIELKPESSQGYEYGYYSITLKKVNSKQCTALVNHAALNQNFVRVELNGSPVSLNGTQQQTVSACKSEWFFQDGKNELKYVAY